VGLPSDVTFDARNGTLVSNVATGASAIAWSGLTGSARLDAVKSTDSLAISGSVTLTVGSSALLGGGFTVTKQTNITISDGVQPQLTSVSLLTVDISGAFLFAGTGASLVLDGDGKGTGIDTTGASGLAATGVTVVLAVVRNAASDKSWTGLAATVSKATPVGLPSDVELELTAAFVRVNTASGTGVTNLAWSGVSQVASTALTALDATGKFEGGADAKLNA